MCCFLILDGVVKVPSQEGSRGPPTWKNLHVFGSDAFNGAPELLKNEGGGAWKKKKTVGICNLF